MYFDLRYRTAHLSSARFPNPGTAGNVPSGETYIVPYEGERGQDSKTSGILPVQEKGEILLFKVEKNRAVSVTGAGPEFEREKTFLAEEPAYGNMGELGFGVLKDFGLSPINEILLDEKLGFHVAFGRSDHFGGIVSPADFSSPAKVIHLDRIYIPETQPDIQVVSIKINSPEGEEVIYRDGSYLIF
jgi:leucyl aminopeptidase (aminopeptidase T)